jgi:hypothetical protein
MKRLVGAKLNTPISSYFIHGAQKRVRNITTALVRQCGLLQLFAVPLAGGRKFVLQQLSTPTSVGLFAILIAKRTSTSLTRRLFDIHHHHHHHHID